MRSLRVLTEATSSSDVVEFEESVILRPILAAALAIPNSPSGPARRCIALGAMPTGIGNFRWKSSVDVSTKDTSRSTRGRISRLAKEYQQYFQS